MFCRCLDICIYLLGEYTNEDTSNLTLRISVQRLLCLMCIFHSTDSINGIYVVTGGNEKKRVTAVRQEVTREYSKLKCCNSMRMISYYIFKHIL